jgi:hypothetical protein
MKKLIKQLINLIFHSGTARRYDFSLYKRAFKHYGQRLSRGWDDSDCWNLDETIAEFVLPRLKKFKENPFGCPSTLTEKEWDTILGKMVHAFEKSLSFHLTKEEDEEVQEGLNLFAEYFFSLWQ